MAGKRRLRPVEELIVPAVAETLQNVREAPEDAGAKRLAMRYAAAIDDAEDPAKALEVLGPKLLSVLESLGGTARGRSLMRATIAAGSPQSRLAAMRAARNG